MHYLTVCAIFRDEVAYLAEWLTHHELQGVDHFYLYDDQSRDAPEAVLAPWLERGVVTLEKVALRSERLRQAYGHCLETRRREARWIAFLDIDEFLFMAEDGEDLPESLARFERHPAVAVNAICYGSAGFEKPIGTQVTTSFQLRAAADFRTSEPGFLKEGCSGKASEDYWCINARIRSIVQPAEVEAFLSRYSFRYRGGAPAVSPSGTPIPSSPLDAFSAEVETGPLRINHYWSKSLVELERKLNRRRVENDDFYSRRTAFLRDAGMSQVYDPSILPWSEAVAAMLGRPFTPGEPEGWKTREAIQQARNIDAELQKIFPEGAEMGRPAATAAVRTRTPHYLGLCAIFRDEARYLPEWLTHYELQGVTRFYLYDDQSRDRPETVLKPWIDRGLVVLERIPPGTRRQRYAYERCILDHRREAFWIAFVDIDEFIFLHGRPEKLADIMTRFEAFPALGVNWLCYGSSGFETPPTALVCTSFQLRGETDFRTNEEIFLKEGMSPDPGNPECYWPYNAHIKSIVRPSEVEGVLSPHSFCYRNDEPAVSPSSRPIPAGPFNAFSEHVETEVIRINHYWSKSQSEFRAKLARNRPDIDKPNLPRPSFLREAAMNQVYDPAILHHAKAVAERLGIPFDPGDPDTWSRRETEQRRRDINAEVLARFGEGGATA